MRRIANIDVRRAHNLHVHRHAAARRGNEDRHVASRIARSVARARYIERQAVCIGVDTAEEAERIFEALSKGGNVGMPIAETFWAKRFGMVTDRFGTPWLVNCEKPR